MIVFVMFVGSTANYEKCAIRQVITQLTEQWTRRISIRESISSELPSVYHACAMQYMYSNNIQQ